MDLYTLQEFLGVLALVAVLTAATLVVGIAFLLFQEAILRLRRLAKTGFLVSKSMGPQERYLPSADG